MRRKYKEGNPLLWLVAIVLSFCIILGYGFYKIQPVIIRYAVSRGETILLNSANDAVLDILNGENVSYEDIVTLSRNDAGLVTSLETDIVKINTLKSLIANRTSELVDSREHYDMDIPLGTFFGNTYTNAMGPKVHLKMQLTATARVDFEHEFKSAGINQVLHIVNIKADISGSLVIIGHKDSFSVSTKTIAAQTIIVGATPEAFTQVIESETDNTAGLINDYGAVAGK